MQLTDTTYTSHAANTSTKQCPSQSFSECCERRIDLDQVVAAYCWEEKLNLAKRPTMTQLVKELVIYLQELQDQYNDSNKATASDKKTTPNSRPASKPSLTGYSKTRKP